MPLLDKDRFLEEVLSYVKFPFDRDDIKSELEKHILDKIEFYIEQGYDQEQAEELSVKDMGDARAIGIELNKEHNPVIGWVWKITNILVVTLVVVSIYMLGLPMLQHRLSLIGYSLDNISESDIVYKIDVNQRVKIDDRIINFTKVIYDNNGVLNIFYETYETKIWLGGWGFSDIGAITDNLGNTYFRGSRTGIGGIRSKYLRRIEDFSKEADTLIINYDKFNRSYRVEIPLQTGDNHE